MGEAEGAHREDVPRDPPGRQPQHPWGSLSSFPNNGRRTVPCHLQPVFSRAQSQF